MDTRTKIIAEAQAVEIAEGFTVVTGYFDVLLADHVRALRKIAEGGRRIIVVVRDSPDALLPQAARAELVAALAMVDYVVASENGGALFQSAEIVHFERDDLRRTAALIEHVHERQRA